VVGGTYMASDVQRDFLMAPNPYVWDQDFADMQRNGVNMVRTGLWSAWDQVTKEQGIFHEAALRAIEAYLMTARRHNMPVQFNLFAFIPDVFGGGNPYLSPEALRREKTFVGALAERFKDVPSLMWDLINEPSFDKPTHLWAMRANGDPFELEKWNEWLRKRYPDHGAIAAAWNSIPVPPGAPVPVPG
jgi:aryl-phospho-beta-D-glucosidase BglC (GH1 family)